MEIIKLDLCCSRWYPKKSYITPHPTTLPLKCSCHSSHTPQMKKRVYFPHLWIWVGLVCLWAREWSSVDGSLQRTCSFHFFPLETGHHAIWTEKPIPYGGEVRSLCEWLQLNTQLTVRIDWCIRYMTQVDLPASPQLFELRDWHYVKQRYVMSAKCDGELNQREELG